MSDYILEIEQLNVGFKDKKVLKNINAKFKRNTISAIIGPSGCGKSTLLKTINTIILEVQEAFVSGQILFDGRNLKQIKPETVREKIGMVFQSPTPFPMSIQKNLEYALKYYGVKRKDREEIIIEKLKVTGLYEEVKNSLHESALKLSGGQQQRLCIARALTIEPDMILLDEPCSALDLKNIMNIESLLLQLKKKYTIIIVTHNLSQAKRIADETMFMLDGEVIEFGETGQIFDNASDRRTRDYVSGSFG
ncbi:phosphate ABC transporter ATP-binding protein [Phosphitispora sp. TUW77]|uniref:phosphate ABC transporter ATP-binding protein n=1 Tax=Phosphitispora sp. TUW77 TaxID=3152361 RepID=UPI003AB225A1